MQRPPQIPPHWIPYEGQWYHPSRLPLGARPVGQSEPNQGGTLERNGASREGGSPRLGGSGGGKAATQGNRGRYRRQRTAKPIVRVLIVAVRRTLGDEEDNLRSGFKPLIDAIAAWLGLDDSDGRIKWEIRQVQGGPPGTFVAVSLIPKTQKRF